MGSPGFSKVAFGKIHVQQRTADIHTKRQFGVLGYIELIAIGQIDIGLAYRPQLIADHVKTHPVFFIGERQVGPQSNGSWRSRNTQPLCPVHAW